MVKRLVAIFILSAIVLSLFGCEAIKKAGGHIAPEVPDDSTELPETQHTKYVYSVLSKSIHLEGCYHINEIKEDYKQETLDDVAPLLEKGYTLCKDCFPPQIEVEPDEDEEPEIPKEQATFLINKNSKKIHKLDCYHIGEMSEANIKYTDLSLEALLEDEHIPCATCMPEQWEQYKKDHPEDFPEDK